MKLRVVVVFLLWSLLPALAQAPPQQKVDPAKEADIRHLLDLVGAKKLMEQTVTVSLEQLKQTLLLALPKSDRTQKIAESFIQRFQKKFTAEGLTDLVIPIYDKYLSEEDIKGLIQFYSSPLGQRAAKVLPEITREAQIAGAQMGEKVAQAVLQEMQEEYPELKQLQRSPSNP